MKKVGVVVFMLMLVSAGNVWASGIAIPEQGAAAMGMSAAVTARSEDLSAIFYNPAGIDYVEGNEVFIGLTPIMPSHTFENGGNSIDAESQIFLPPQLYAARRMNDSVVLGIGVFAPFGLGTDWDKEWNGRYASTYGEIQTLYVNPTLAVKLSEQVSFGFGLSYIYSKANIERMVDTGLALYGASGNNAALAPNIASTTFDSNFALEGTGSGFGFNVGALVKPTEKLQVGVSYRGASNIKYKGTAKFTHNEAAIKAIPGMGTTLYNNVAALMPAKQDGQATIHLPWMLNLGIKYDITDVWDVSADFDYVGWEKYDSLVLDFSDDKPYKMKIEEKAWENTPVYRLGTSYDVGESLVLRGGIMFDQSPVPDSTIDGQLPDSDRTGVSIGIGYKLGMIQIDASYLYLSFDAREKDNLVGYSDVTNDVAYGDTYNTSQVVTTADQATLDGALALQGRGKYPVGNGDYESSANLFALSLSYKF